MYDTFFYLSAKTGGKIQLDMYWCKNKAESGGHDGLAKKHEIELATLLPKHNGAGPIAAASALDRPCLHLICWYSKKSYVSRQLVTH